MTTIKIVAIAAVLNLVIGANLFAQAQKPLTLEGLPDKVTARLEVKNRAAANVHSGRVGVQYFMFFSKRWPNAATTPITVAFLGGDDNLRRQIETTASEWDQYGKLRFDFRVPSTGAFREWSRSDTTFAADIRVAFDGIDGPGYWSLVGTDGSDPTVIGPGEASLELQGFATAIPPDWQATVRHEFGHALGLMHEHQMPVGGCDQDFKFEDDAGYIPTQDAYGQYINDTNGRKPGLYTMLAGAPNFWPKQKVDQNLKQLTADSQNYDFGPFDVNSIMKYYFDPRMFRDGTNAHCYSAENLVISKEDQEGVSKWYPNSQSELNGIMHEQSALMNALQSTHKMVQVQSIQPMK